MLSKLKANVSLFCLLASKPQILTSVFKVIQPIKWIPGPWFYIKMSSYQYRKSHCGDKTVVRLSYRHKGISYTGKMTSFYWISPQSQFMAQNVFILCYLIEVGCNIYVSMNWVIIWSDNGFCQAVIWTNVDILSIKPKGKHFSEIVLEI